jgi:hypothetical protein
MITTILVTSKDGVGFSVSFYSRTEAQARAAERAEAAFAATRLACQLDGFGDYHRVIKSMDDLTGLPFVYNPVTPKPVTRPALTLIKGGKS